MTIVFSDGTAATFTEVSMLQINAPFKRSLTFVAALFWIMAAWVQVAQSCETANSETIPPRQIISCGNAVTIEREPTADLRITKHPNSPAPRVIQVQGGAILIKVLPGQAATQVRTPHAIATVRGTTYIVDAAAEQTSVFVLEGGVDVKRTNDASTFKLNAGEGADASLDEPISVGKWGVDRAEELLARFGR